eukprot:6472068-Amphidinium_carterae.2
MVSGKDMQLVSGRLCCTTVGTLQVAELRAAGQARVQAPPPGLETTGEEEEDIRVLPIRLDGNGERWRTMAESAGSSREEVLGDYPLEGPRSLLWLVKQLARSNMNFRHHHEAWVRNSGIRGNDRAVHEYKSLTRLLDYAVSYDQLQVCNLACLEVVARRLVIIEEAYRLQPEAPSYGHAEYMSGVLEKEDGTLIPPALKKHTAERLKADAEVAKETKKAKEVAYAAREAAKGKKEQLVQLQGALWKGSHP